VYNSVVYIFYREDITVSMDARVGKVNGTDGVFLAVRIDRGGTSTGAAKGAYFYLYPANKTYHLTSDLGKAADI
jgi:hypothetical protein